MDNLEEETSNELQYLGERVFRLQAPVDEKTNTCIVTMFFKAQDNDVIVRQELVQSNGAGNSLSTRITSDTFRKLWEWLNSE